MSECVDSCQQRFKIEAQRKHPETDLDTAIASLAANYIDRVLMLVRGKSLNIIFQGVPVPNVDISI